MVLIFQQITEQTISFP